MFYNIDTEITTMKKQSLVSDADIETFWEDGVVCLRGLFTDWIEKLEQGAAFHIANPSQSALTHKANSHSGEFLEDFCCWNRIPEYTDFVHNSSLGQIAANLMKSNTAQFFHDHFLYKEASSGVPTPWHQDQPYYCVNGEQTVSLWVPLNARDRSVSLRCAAGSHLLPREIRPTSWSSNESFYSDDNNFMDIPDIDNNEFEIKQWAMQPGDAVAFNFRTIHGANANTLSTANRTLSFRLIGDDVKYRDRGGRTSPNFPDINQNNGEPLRSDWFPIIYDAQHSIV